MLMLAPAIHKCVSGPASVTKFCNPTETGHQLDPALVAISGHSKAFHELINAKMTTVVSGGRESGSVVIERGENLALEDPGLGVARSHAQSPRHQVVGFP